jgi:hypothetical protein
MKVNKMKLLIQQHGINRKLEGAFEIHGTARDLKSLAHQILGTLSKTGDSNKFFHGWIEIWAAPPELFAGNKPIEWHETPTTETTGQRHEFNEYEYPCWNQSAKTTKD